MKRLVKFASLLAKERFCDFIRDVELSLPIHTFDHHLAMPCERLYPIRFLSSSPPSRRLVPDVRVRFLLAFIVYLARRMRMMTWHKAM